MFQQDNEYLMMDKGPNSAPVMGEITAIAPPRQAPPGPVASAPPPQAKGVPPKAKPTIPSTLRHVLGVIGDAFLVQEGLAPVYGPRQERMKEGQAMQGFNENPQQAIEAMAALGTPGAMKNSQYMLDYTQQGDLKRQQQEALQQHQKDQLNLRLNQQEDLVNDREDRIIQTMAPRVGGLLSQAETPEQYAQAYELAQTMARRVNPRYGAEDFGAVHPDEWRAGMYAGVTGGNVLSADTSTANNIRSTNTSRDNNIRTTTTSAENNMRTTGISAANNIRSNANRGGGSGRGGGNPKPKAGDTRPGPNGMSMAQARLAQAAKGKNLGPPGESRNPYVPRTAREFNSIPPGSYYYDRDGTKIQKPKR